MLKRNNFVFVCLQFMGIEMKKLRMKIFSDAEAECVVIHGLDFYVL